MSFKTDLEALVLGIVDRGPTHGYEITRRINQAGESSGVRVQEGQIYPILHRLQNDGHLSATWEGDVGKPPRKIYHLTESGGALLERKRAAWEGFSQTVSALLAGGREARNHG
jgi:PadR family transcriptional regulator, regulatory protein PadR